MLHTSTGSPFTVNPPISRKQSPSTIPGHPDGEGIDPDAIPETLECLMNALEGAYAETTIRAYRSDRGLDGVLGLDRPQRLYFVDVSISHQQGIPRSLRAALWLIDS